MLLTELSKKVNLLLDLHFYKLGAHGINFQHFVATRRRETHIGFQNKPMRFFQTDNNTLRLTTLISFVVKSFGRNPIL